MTFQAIYITKLIEIFGDDFGKVTSTLSDGSIDVYPFSESANLTNFFLKKLVENKHTLNLKVDFINIHTNNHFICIISNNNNEKIYCFKEVDCYKRFIDYQLCRSFKIYSGFHGVSTNIPCIRSNGYYCHYVRENEVDSKLMEKLGYVLVNKGINGKHCYQFFYNHKERIGFLTISIENELYYFNFYNKDIYYLYKNEDLLLKTKNLREINGNIPKNGRHYLQERYKRQNSSKAEYLVIKDGFFYKVVYV